MAETLFDLQKAEQERNEFLDQVSRNADRQWKAEALDAIRIVCRIKEEFIVDDCWAYVGKPREARAMGAMMREAKRVGYCEATERFKPSSQVKCHANPRRIWRSLLYNGGSQIGVASAPEKSSES